MAKYNLYLRDKTSKDETSILLYISWNNVRLKYPTKEVVNPKDWDFKKQNVIDTRRNTELREKNLKITNFVLLIRELFVKYENIYKKHPTTSELKKYLDEEIYKKNKTEFEINKTVNELTLIEYIQNFIDESSTRSNEKTGKPIAKGTIDTYKQVYNMINDYSNIIQKDLTFNDIDLDFYFKFNAYLTKKGLSTNTIGKRIAILKTILREATDRGLNKNLSFQSKRFKVIREKTDNIYLNDDELLELYNLDLSDNTRLDNVRDLFLIGCYTGLRFSDFSILSKKNIDDNYIEIETQKVRDTVAIPLHYIVKQIIIKHNGELPRALSNQRMNSYLKEIGAKMDSLKVDFSKSITKGGEEITTNYKKYQLLTTHTARRSFSSNLFIDGIPAQTIMKITGHKTEKSFMQYIKITPKENANIIKAHWDKKYKMMK